MKQLTKLNVLFVNIGWAGKYDGQHQIYGNHKDVKNQGGNPSKLSEGKAFLPDSNGFVRCGAGIGKVPSGSPIDFLITVNSQHT